MDRHKYVKVAYHGFREMSKEEKMATYGNTLIRDSFDEPEYALIDTLFSLAEAYLFAQLVDFKDKNPGKIPENVEYVVTHFVRWYFCSVGCHVSMSCSLCCCILRLLCVRFVASFYNLSKFCVFVCSYGKMYRDVRAAVDLCHRDGTLKRMVAQDPGKYELRRRIFCSCFIFLYFLFLSKFPYESFNSTINCISFSVSILGISMMIPQ